MGGGNGKREREGKEYIVYKVVIKLDFITK
jgi:hypothetical protein